MDRSCKFEGGVSQKLKGIWLFFCDCFNGVIKDTFIMSIDYSYGAIQVNVMEICAAKCLSLIWR